ncbi:MAG: hypothetical protein GY711_30760 [bacterium]|nr:hypothetical protein [bacterium]
MELSSVLLAFAVPCLVAGIALMLAMVSAVQERGQKINWFLIRLLVPKYVARYREVTIEESGRPGPLFYPFLIAMNLALVLTVVGLVLR